MKQALLLLGLLYTCCNPPYAIAQVSFQCPPGMICTPAQGQESFAIPYGGQQTALQFSSVSPNRDFAGRQYEGLSVVGQYPTESHSQQGELRLEVLVENPQAVIGGQAPIVAIYETGHGTRSLLRRWLPRRLPGEEYDLRGCQPSYPFYTR